MTGNLAIFDERAIPNLLALAENEDDWGMAYLMLKEGMHPTQIVRLKPSDLHDSWLMWKRVKNEKPRQAFIPEDVRARLEAFLKSPRLCRKTMWARARALSEKAGYGPYTPREYRKTAILSWIREYRGRNDMMFLVAARAGCSVEVVTRHYLSLIQWEDAGKPSEVRA